MSPCSKCKCGAEGPFLSLSKWSMCPSCREEAFADLLAKMRTMDKRFASMKNPPDGKTWAALTGNMMKLLERLAAILPENPLPETDRGVTASGDEPYAFTLEEIRLFLASSVADEARLRSAAAILDRLFPFMERRSPENLATLLKLRSRIFSILAKNDREHAASLMEKIPARAGKNSQLPLI